MLLLLLLVLLLIRWCRCRRRHGNIIIISLQLGTGREGASGSTNTNPITATTTVAVRELRVELSLVGPDLLGAHELGWRCGADAVVHGALLEAGLRAGAAARRRPRHGHVVSHACPDVSPFPSMYFVSRSNLPCVCVFYCACSVAMLCMCSSVRVCLFFLMGNGLMYVVGCSSVS